MRSTHRSSHISVSLMLAVLCLSATSFAQSEPAEAPGTEQTERPDGGSAAIGYGTANVALNERSAENPSSAQQSVRIVVSVENVDDDLRVQVAEGASVKLSIIRPPHEVVRTLEGTTNTVGEAVFTVDVAEGQQAFASAQLGEREVFSDSGVTLDRPGETTIFVRSDRETNDTSTVFAPRVITIAELWEDYIVFTQIWTLATSAPVRVLPDSSTKTSGLEIPLPDDASGIRVIQPAEGVNVSETSLYYQQPIEPAGTGSSGAPSVVVRFSIKHDNASSLAWNQPLLFAVENASVVVPQGTQHRRFERLDVMLDVPLCGDSPDRGAMCFEDIRNRAEGVPMLEGVAVQIAGAGRTQDLPSVMRVNTTGWPTPVPVSTIVSIIAVVISLLTISGFVLFEIRNRRGGQTSETRLAHLVAERERRLQEAGRLRARLDRAELLESEYELEFARLREELAMIEQRIRAAREIADSTLNSEPAAGA